MTSNGKNDVFEIPISELRPIELDQLEGVGIERIAKFGKGDGGIGGRRERR